MYVEALIPRNGLGNLATELSASPCTIVYLGNSITAQKDSYRIPLHNHIVAHFRKVHKPVNAGLGGVGSLACAFLIDELVLRHRPALCFVECSAADTGRATPHDAVGPSVEGIIRQLLTAGTRVVLLHLFRRADMAIEKEKILGIYESLAEHYGIPSIHLDRLFSEQIASGMVREEELFHDGIHTTLKGAALTGRIIFSALNELFRISSISETDLPQPVCRLPYQYTMILPVTGEMLVEGVTLQKKRYRDILEYVEFNPGVIVSLRQPGLYIRAILIVADEDCGVVMIENEGTSHSIQTWDEWCFMPRIQAIILDKPVQPGSELRLFLSAMNRGDQGATGAPNPHERVGKNLKIIGFMVYSEHPVVKTSLFGD
jgi:hypothetical protein